MASRTLRITQYSLQRPQVFLRSFFAQMPRDQRYHPCLLSPDHFIDHRLSRRLLRIHLDRVQNLSRGPFGIIPTPGMHHTKSITLVNPLTQLGKVRQSDRMINLILCPRPSPAQLHHCQSQIPGLNPTHPTLFLCWHLYHHFSLRKITFGILNKIRRPSQA